MKILVVDDDKLNLRVTQTTLKAKDHWEVLVASSGQEALGLAASEAPDVILLDALMPQMDGLETLLRLRAQASTSHIPVIFLTGSSEAIEHYKGSDVLGVLSKPFNPMTLHDEIRRLLEKQSNEEPPEEFLVTSEEPAAQEDIAFEALLDAVPGAVLRLQEDGTLLSFKTDIDNNAGIYKPLEEAQGQHLAALFPEKVAAQFQQNLKSALAGGGQQRFMYRVLHHNMLRNYQAQLIPLKGREALVVVRQLLEGDFFSGISHVLRTSLTSIRGSVGLLELGVLGELPPEAMEVVKGVRFTCDHMSQFIQDFLELANAEAGWPVSMRVTDPARCIEIALERSHERAEQASILLESEIVAKGSVLADKGLLLQALHRLISWALCCSPSGEKVSVAVKPARGALRFSVTDFGGERPSLIQKFQFPKEISNSLPSTGLEIALSKAILEQLGTGLQVEHHQPRGTTLWFELPLYIPAISEKAEPVEP